MINLFFTIFLTFLATFSYAESYLNEGSFWKYKYENEDHNGNIVHKGSATFLIKKENGLLYELSSIVETGDLSFNKFEVVNKIPEGNILYDVINLEKRNVYLQFSPYLIANNSKIISLENKFPKTSFPVFSYHNQISWTFSSQIIGNEIIQLQGKSFDTIKVVMNGQRPTGPGGCMQGQPGIINIESWYSKEYNRYIKQVVKEFHCSIDSGKLLSKETYELISSSDTPKKGDEKVNALDQKEKLIELKGLFDKGLITKKIYIERQRKILESD